MNYEDVQVIRTLCAARELVLRGWCQGAAYSYKNGAKQYCMVGAIWKGDELFGVGPAAEQALGRTVWGSLPCFNDKPGMTKEKVLAAFDATIERLEGAHGK